MKDKKIAVVMGGPSTEREISFMTGNAILDALKEKGYAAETIDLEPGCVAQQLKACGAEVVFNAVHGLYGEDGRLQSLLEMLEIPYTGSGVLASAISMDKVFSKRIFQAMGVPTPRSIILRADELSGDPLQSIFNEFSLPVVVKPAAQGSSIGIEIVKQKEDLAKALAGAFQYGTEILVEEFIDGKELTVAVMGGAQGAEALPVIQIVPHSGSYDYKSKYTKGATEYLVPAPLTDEETKLVQKAAVQAYNALGCMGVARADMMLSKQGQAFVLEINSIPGMTATSLVPKAAAAAGISFPDLCERILLTAHK